MVRSCPHKLKESDGDGESEVDAATRCHGALTPDPNLIRGNKGLSPPKRNSVPFMGRWSLRGRITKKCTTPLQTDFPIAPTATAANMSRDVLNRDECRCVSWNHDNCVGH